MVPFAALACQSRSTLRTRAFGRKMAMAGKKV